MLKFNVLIVLITMVVLNSCGNVLNSDNNIIKTKIDDPKIQSIAGFPNNIGNFWKYIVYDTTDQGNTIIDTLEVKIVAASFNSIPNSNTWVYNFKVHPENNYSRIVQIKDSSVYEYESQDSKGIKIYEFPLNLGRKWYVGNLWDSTLKIDNAEIISSEIGYLKGKPVTSYKVKRTYKINDGVFVGQTFDFIPEVGLLSNEFAKFWVGYKKYVLLDYTLN